MKTEKLMGGTGHGPSGLTQGLKTALALASALLIGWGSQAQTTIGFPDADPTSGRFINTTIGLKTLGDVPIGGKPLNLSIMVPKSQGNSFIVSIFDGDFSGSWDIVSLPPDGLAGLERVIYKIYADPDLVGNTDPNDMIWSQPSLDYNPDGTEWSMPDNGWFEATITDSARSGYNAEKLAYYYHLVCEWEVSDTSLSKQNNFKLAVTGGQPFLLAGSSIGFLALKDAGPILPATTYDGTFTFNFLVTGPTERIDLWDGDADLAADTADFNSPAFPPFLHSSYTVAQGANSGSPRDDHRDARWRISPAVQYVVTSPDGQWQVQNLDPSGNTEWELFQIVSSSYQGSPDVVIPSPKLPAGLYEWQFRGLDFNNDLFITLDYDLYSVPPPPPPGGAGTPGYWKNHPEAWPVQFIVIGGITYTKDQAIAYMKLAEKYTTGKKADGTCIMFFQLVAAVLNVELNKANPDWVACVTEGDPSVIAAAQAWMTAHPLGSAVKCSSPVWTEVGEPLKNLLDAYNNGLLCCPSRDSLE